MVTMVNRSMKLIQNITVLKGVMKGYEEAYRRGEIPIDTRDKGVGRCKERIKKLRDELRDIQSNE